MERAPQRRIGFVGLGAMGSGMAKQLVRRSYAVKGYDVVPSALENFGRAGGLVATSPRDAADGSDMLVIVTTNSSQVDSVLFGGDNGAVHSLVIGATVVVCSTVAPSYHETLQTRLQGLGRQDLKVIDAPISGGAKKAAEGRLTILASGSEVKNNVAWEIINDMAENLYIIPGGAGKASMVKMINQLLAGVHIAAAAEAMALAATMALNTSRVFKAVNESESWSWMFEDRVEHMLRDDWTPKSALSIFVKDMGIVMSTARHFRTCLPLSEVAEKLYVSASEAGIGREDDSGLVRTSLPKESPHLIKELSGRMTSGSEDGVELIMSLLNAVHLVVTAEALSFAVRIGLDVNETYKIIQTAAGASRVFVDAGHEMIRRSNIEARRVQEASERLAVVLNKAEAQGFSAPLATAAMSILRSCQDEDSTENDEMALIELLRPSGMHGVTFSPRDCPRFRAKEALSRLPGENTIDALSTIKSLLKNSEIPRLVVLDDDPTGTQTCHGISVLTTWEVDTLQEEFSSDGRGCFILTNSRAFNPDEVRKLLNEVLANVKEAARAVGIRYEIVLRGDSTLRGHFALEVEAATNSLGNLDGLVMAPFFFQGGRYTIDDIHFVKEGEDLVPAAQTQFAEDRTFGYKSSHLCDYVTEKTGKRKRFLSVTIDNVRLGGPEKVAGLLKTTHEQTVVIVNAAAESDMHIFCVGLLLATMAGKRFLFRTGAAFVSSRLGIDQIQPLRPDEVDARYYSRTTGGLIVAGSYVPKTTEQLAVLRNGRGTQLQTLEVDVEDLMKRDHAAVQSLMTSVSQEVSRYLSSGRDVLIMSSRKLITGTDGASSLSVGSVVARALVDIVRMVSVRPRYLLAKGGITSSDAATKILEIKKATIMGQSTAGSPIWKSEEPTSKWPGIPFIVFPGNVGGAQTLKEVVAKWSIPMAAS